MPALARHAPDGYIRDYQPRAERNRPAIVRASRAALAECPRVALTYATEIQTEIQTKIQTKYKPKNEPKTNPKHPREGGQPAGAGCLGG